MTAHTPGPWTLICTRNRRVIEYVTIQQDDGTPYGNRVAGINADEISDTNKETVSNEALANARLIAAAPELYEVVRGLVEAMPLMSGFSKKFADQARAAKVRG